jgi:ATP-dependent Lon protease
LLTIEVADMPGKGVIQRTGSIGDVMKESVEAARSVVRARAARLGIPDNVFEKRDIHVHFPEGATPKDGPSAGITMATALLSLIRNKMIKKNFAMTGELSLKQYKGAVADSILSPKGFYEIDGRYVDSIKNKVKFDVRGKSRSGITGLAFRIDLS